MSSKIWLYGDSFTHGEGTRAYYSNLSGEYFDTYSKYFFGDVLRDNWYPDYDLVNRGYSGASADWILYQVNEGMVNWKKDDIVVIGHTIPYRISVPVKTPRFNHEECRSWEMDWSEERGYAYDHFGNWILEDEMSDWMKESVFYSPETIDGIKQFYKEAIIGNMQEFKHHNEYIRDLLLSIAETVIKLGVRVIVWDYNMWASLETLQGWSNSVIDDLHWSPNGNVQFAHLLKDTLDAGIHDITFKIDFQEYREGNLQWENHGITKVLSHLTNTNESSGEKIDITPNMEMRSKSYIDQILTDKSIYDVKYNPNIEYKTAAEKEVTRKTIEEQSKSFNNLQSL